MIQGFENPIRNMEDEDIASALSITLPICAELYCGIKKSEFNQDVLIECINYIDNNFSNIGVIEIKQAFEMAASNKLNNVDLKAYYGRFNISMLGDILSAYYIERNKIVNKLLDLHERNEAGETFINEVDHKNFIARQEVIYEFKTELENIREGKERKYKDWSQIREHWSRILIDRGIIELSAKRKEELWEEAKKLVVAQTRLTASDYTNIYEAKGARQILKQFENPKDQTLKQKAEVIYGKLYVWEFLK